MPRLLTRVNRTINRRQLMTFCHYPLWASYTIDTTLPAYPVRLVRGKALGLTYHRTRYPVRLVRGKLSSGNHIAYPMPNTISL